MSRRLALALLAALCAAARADDNPPAPGDQNYGPGRLPNTANSPPNTGQFLSPPNTKQYLSLPNTASGFSVPNTQQSLSVGNSLPRTAMPQQDQWQQQQGSGAKQDAIPDGVYRSTRGDASSWSPGGISKPSVSSTETDGVQPATLKSARENIAQIVSVYVAKHSHHGYYALLDPLTPTPRAVRLESVDAAGTKDLGGGRFVAEARFTERSGRRVLADARVETSGDSWKVAAILAKKSGESFDPSFCFSEAVARRVRAGTRAGVFAFRDEAEGKDWRLKFRRTHTERLASYGQHGWFSCVDFTDAAGRTVDLDFYASAADGTCSIDQIVVHRVAGVARTIKPKPLGAQ